MVSTSINQLTDSRLPFVRIAVLLLISAFGVAVAASSTAGTGFSPEVAVLDVAGIDGTVWLSTSEGAFRWTENGPPRRIAAETGTVWHVRKAGGVVWLLTSSGLWRVEGDTSRPFPLPGRRVVTIEDVAGLAWVRTDAGNGLIRGDRYVPLTEEPFGFGFNLSSLREVGSQAWFTDSKKTFRVEQDGIVLLEGVAGLTGQPLQSGNTVWVPTEDGLWETENGKPVRHFLPGERVLCLREWGGVHWVATESGAWRLEGGEARRVLGGGPVSSHGPFIIDIQPSRDGMWFLDTEGKAFNLKGDKLSEHVGVYCLHANGNGTLLMGRDLEQVQGSTTRPLIKGCNIFDYREVDGRLWMLCCEGGCYLAKGAVVRRVLKGVEVKDIQAAGGSTFIATDRGCWQLYRGGLKRITPKGKEVSVLKNAGNQVWIVLADGALYRACGRKVERLHPPADPPPSGQWRLEATLPALAEQGSGEGNRSLVEVLFTLANVGSRPLLVLNGVVPGDHREFDLLRVEYATSRKDAEAGRYIEMACPYSNFHSNFDSLADWEPFRIALDREEPPPSILRLNPGDLHTFSARFELKVPKETETSTVPAFTGQGATPRRMWLRFTVSGWPEFFGIQDEISQDFDRLGPILARRWRKFGELVQGRLISKPFFVELPVFAQGSGATSP